MIHSINCFVSLMKIVGNSASHFLYPCECRAIWIIVSFRRIVKGDPESPRHGDLVPIVEKQIWLVAGMLGFLRIFEHSLFCMTRLCVNLNIFALPQSSQVFPHPATVESSPENLSVSKYPLGSSTGWIDLENVILDGKMISAMSNARVVLLNWRWIR